MGKKTLKGGKRWEGDTPTGGRYDETHYCCWCPSNGLRFRMAAASSPWLPLMATDIVVVPSVADGDTCGLW